jgi:cytochrome c
MMDKAKIIMARLTLGGLLLLAVPSWCAGATATPKVPQGWKLSLPDGDANAGKTVFLTMKCYSCHAIEIPGEKFPPSRSKDAGPTLTGYGVLPKEYLAESIIKFHTVVAAPGYVVKEGRAAMGEYNHFLTVQEVIDLVAFLKQRSSGAGK